MFLTSTKIYAAFSKYCFIAMLKLMNGMQDIVSTLDLLMASLDGITAQEWKLIVGSGQAEEMTNLLVGLQSTLDAFDSLLAKGDGQI